MSTARNAQQLDALGFEPHARFAQVVDAAHPSAQAHTASFLFAQKKTKGPPDYLVITCAGTGPVKGHMTLHSQGGRLIHVEAPMQTACVLFGMPVHDATAWSGSFRPSADAKLSRAQLGFTYTESSDGEMSNIQFGW